MNGFMITVGVLSFLLGFFIAANNPDEAVVAKGIAGRFLNALRRVVVKIKGLLTRKKKASPPKAVKKATKKKSTRVRRG